MKTLFRQALAVLVLVYATSGDAAGAIVVSKASPLQSLTADDAPRVFLGLQRNIQGQGVTVLFQRSGPVREEFNQKELGRTGPELSSYHAALVFTGRAVPPVEVSNDDQVKQAVNANPNAIGYISDDAVDDTVKVLLHY